MATASGPPQAKEFYIPHKPVVRVAAESTKLRIVYDASAWTNHNATNLNDCLYPGPPLQNYIWNVLVHMRFHPVALTGDLKRAFLQLRIKKEERDVLRFHWKSHQEAEAETLRFTCTLFSLTSLPFLISGVIKSHLNSWEAQNPELITELRRSLYVDDLGLFQ